MSNIVLNPGAGGSTLATDTVAGVDTQIIKIGVGAAGVAPTLVSTAAPLPVTLQTVGATQNVSITNATLAVTQSGSWSVSITGTATVSGTVTANQGGAPWTMKPDGTSWALTGTSANVNVTNASIPVTGTFWQATQPVSGTVTANAGTGSFTVAQATAANLNATVTGTVAVDHDLCIYPTKLGQWPSGIFFGDPYTLLEGNQGVGASIGGRWYIGAADWYRPGQACKDVTADTIGHDAFYNPAWEPLRSWVPRRVCPASRPKSAT